MLEVRDLCKNFGGIKVTQNVSFQLAPGERRVILGPNGAGKTTLFNLLAGTLDASSGDILLEGRSIAGLSAAKRAKAGMARSYQKNNLFDELTVRENLALAAGAAQRKAHWMVRDTFRDKGVKEAVEEAAAQVSLADHLDLPVSSASYGMRRQLEVGIALAQRPRVLLMDEPTSGVGPSMIDGFHRLLHALPKELTVLIIEHDMDLAFDVADRITVLNFGEVVFEGTPDETRGNPVVREIYLGDWQEDA
ncbi:ABC transporter ATP-binding protein [Rhodovulum sp. DZ06]|uniref:ABC transporter ATP-binding protein n=1 Tax=Rhodovulum sp. DZ06 TaxID=3425126 RepID=UPI003D3533E7